MLSNLFGIYTGIRQAGKSKKMQAQADREWGQTLGYANDGMNLAKQGLSEARNIYNGRMAGAAGMEQNLYGQQANTMGAINRNATSGAQALALAGNAIGATNQGFANLAQIEAQDKQNRYGYVQAGRAGVQAANQNMQGLMEGRYNQSQQSASQLGQASQQNIMNGIKGYENFLINVATMGMSGGLGGGSSVPQMTAPLTSQLGSAGSFITPAMQFATAPGTSNIQAPQFATPASFYQVAPQMPTWNMSLPIKLR